jgi:O-antigen ligase/tetratricopeptide (TPR) repeat protein
MPSRHPSHSSSSRRHRPPTGELGVGAKAVGVLLFLLLIAAPWLFGGVEMTRWLWPAPIVALACWTWMLGRRSAPNPIVPWAAVPVVLVLAFAAFQLSPLSGDLLGRLSPKALSLWTDSQSLTQPIDDPAAVSAPISLEPEGGRLQMTWLALGLCVFILSAQFLRSAFGIIGLFAVSTIVGTAVAVFAVVQGTRYDGKLYWFFELATTATPFGPFINRNHGGAFMNLCFAGAVGFLWFVVARRDSDEGYGRWTIESESFKTRMLAVMRHLEGVHVLAFACVVFIAGGLVSSLSRGAAASAAAGVGGAMLIALLQRRDSPSRMPLGMYVASFLLLGSAVGFVYLIGAEEKAFARLNTLVGESDTGQKSRARHWNDMFPAVDDFKTTGAGLGSYVRVHRLYTPNNHGYIFEHADNTYLEILVEMGFLGAALTVLFIFCCARAIFFVVRRDPRPVGRVLALAAGYVLATQVLHHAVDFPLYSPANLLLFSAWMGAVCGRAGHIAAATRDDGRRYWFVSFPLGRWQTAGALPTGILLALGLWSWWEASTQERLEWTLRSHRLNPATAKTSLAQADERVQELDGLAARHPSRPALREQLGDRWIERCRVQAKESMLASNPNLKAEEVWTKTDLMMLYAQIFGAARMGQGAMLEVVRNSSAVAENLPRAKENLLAAAQLSPLSVGPRLKLALMPYLLESPAKREMLVDQAAALAPGDAAVMYRVGLLEFHADRREKVIPAWRRSLEVSQTWSRPIFQESVRWLPFERVINEVFPPDAQLLVNAAEGLIPEKDQKHRAIVFERALEVLPQSTLSKADKNETAARAFKGLAETETNVERSLEHYTEAARCFEEASSVMKNRPNLWLSLADCYEKLGKEHDAARAVGIAAGLLPNRPDVAKRAFDLRTKADQPQAKASVNPATSSNPPPTTRR